MPIQVKCTNLDCAKSLRVNDDLAGKTVRCPACKTAVKVVGASAPAMAPATAKVVAKPAAPPPMPKKPAPAPVPAKTSPKPPPEDDVPTLEGFDDFDDAPPAKTKITNKPASAKKPVRDEEDAPPAAGREEGRPEKRRLQTAEAGRDPFEGLEVPESMQEGILEELEKGEEIVWVGRPMTEILMKKARLAFIIGIAMAVVGVSSLVAGIVVGSQVVFLIGLCVGGFLTLVSIPCMLAPILLRRFNHKRPCYVVTGKRAILYHGGLLGARSFDRRQLMVHLDRQESSFVEGAGSLIFEVEIDYDAGTTMGHGHQARTGVRERKIEHGFLDVERVADVEQLIRDTIIMRKPGQPEESLPSEDEEKPATPTPKKQGKAAVEDADVRLPSRGGERRTRDRDESRVAGDSGEVVHESNVHEKLKPKILNRLTADEEAIWVGRPLPRLVLLRSLPPAIIAMVMSVVMCIFVLSSGSFREWWVFLGLGGVFLIGLLMPFYRLLVAQYTAYVLTTRRCLVFEPDSIGKTKATVYLPDIVSKMRRSASWFHKGAGDLIFRTKTVITTTTTSNRRTGASSSSSSVSETHYGFLAIDDMAAVEKLVNRHLVEPYLDRVHGV